MQEAAKWDERPIAAGLGLFGLGIGAAEVVAPRMVRRLVGVRARRGRWLIRLFGLREIAAGVGVLGDRRPARWLWARVVGDVLDLAVLVAALGTRRARRGRLAFAIAAVGGIAALDVRSALRTRDLRLAPSSPRIRRSITVATGPDHAYRFWRELGNHPKFMSRIESVDVLSAERSRWRARGPAGRILEWEAELVEDRENEAIAWRSVEGSKIASRGRTSFRPAPGRRGTEVEVELEWTLPASELGRSLAPLSKKALGLQLENDLRRFKQVLETGEVVRSDASVHRGLHPARPDAKEGRR